MALDLFADDHNLITEETHGEGEQKSPADSTWPTPIGNDAGQGVHACAVDEVREGLTRAPGPSVGGRRHGAGTRRRRLTQV